MDRSELLGELQRKNKEAFKELTQTYGPSIYRRLAERSGDPALAKQALKAALTELYLTVSAADDVDPLEALLCRRAMELQDGMRQGAIGRAFEEAADAAGIEGASVKAPAPKDDADAELPELKLRRASGGRIAAGILLGLGIAFLVWVIVGLLMSMELLPPLDLGYSRFNDCIAPWF